jgi:DNA-binding NtrC family response regulator
VHLVADRFAPLNGTVAVDLATGEPVTLIVSSAGGPWDMSRWSARCDLLFRLHHWALASLVDYGRCGETQRFEAWRCGEACLEPPASSDRLLHAARGFLRANRLQPGALSLRVWRERLVAMPDEESGYEASDPGEPDTACDFDEWGLGRIDRPLVTSAAEVFGESTGTTEHVLALWGPEGSGLHVSVRELSRAARLQGFVPLSIRVQDRRLLDLVLERSLFLIARDGRGWQAALEWTLCSPRAHVLMFVGRDEVRYASSVPLTRLTPDALANAVRPQPLAPSQCERVRRAAAAAEGLPGRFARLLWSMAPPCVPRVPGSRVAVAAERSVTYGRALTHPERDTEVATSSSRELRLLPARSDSAVLRQRLDEAIALAREGHHAPADRAIRATVAALARRQVWSAAASGCLALGASLLKRGRSGQASDVLHDAQRYIAADTEAGDGSITCSALGLDAAILAGRAWTDSGKLEEAERVLTAARAVARARGDGSRLVSIEMELARCWFWRGRYTDAERVLRSTSPSALPRESAVRVGLMAARVAVGLRDYTAAIASATAALAEAQRSNDAALIARAACVTAFAHLAIGDLTSVGRDVSECVAAARLARDPLTALKGRLLDAESARRQGRNGLGSILVARTDRLSAFTLPAIVSARCALLKDLVEQARGASTAGMNREGELVRRHISASGLNALALFVAGEPDSVRSLRSAMEDAVDILRLCQSAEDDGTVLSEVCARVRARLRATGAAFFAEEGSRVVVVASDGKRIDSSLPERVLAARQPIPPHASEGIVQAGAPLRQGAEVTGAFAVRWSIGTAPDPVEVNTALTMAATAAGPALAAVVARRKRPPPDTVTELIGVSAAMVDLRRAVDRAAAAPFSVLIEGESGSGKELVARALHRQSLRRERPYCTLNCAALPDDLVEAELFGHARGAFTGAVTDRIGVFEEAHTGTLFLDEIGELSPRAQAKLLRTIQEGDLRRVGENLARRVDVRLVSATNRDLRHEAGEGRFRRDLLYRLDVIRIRVPPLRERREDIAPLADHFWRKAAERTGSRAVLGDSCLAALARYDWPGNVRELQNALASLVVRSPKRGVIAATALPPPFGAAEGGDAWRLEAARRSFEERFVRAALVRSGGHRGRAAHELGITRQGLTKLMTRLGIVD